MAAQENHDSVVKYLLSKGANQTLATEVRTKASFFDEISQSIVNSSNRLICYFTILFVLIYYSSLIISKSIDLILGMYICFFGIQVLNHVNLSCA